MFIMCNTHTSGGYSVYTSPVYRKCTYESYSIFYICSTIFQKFSKIFPIFLKKRFSLHPGTGLELCTLRRRNLYFFEFCFTRCSTNVLITEERDRVSSSRKFTKLRSIFVVERSNVRTSKTRFSFGERTFSLK